MQCVQNHEIYTLEKQYQDLNKIKKTLTYESLPEFVEQYEMIMMSQVQCERDIKELREMIDMIQERNESKSEKMSEYRKVKAIVDDLDK